MSRLLLLLVLLPLMTLLSACAGVNKHTKSVRKPVRSLTASERLDDSTRHQEWVVDHDATGRERRSFVVYPERSEPTSAVVVIHENRGLNDWARAVADQLAENGYLAIAPDLLHGSGPGGAGTAAFADSDAARTGIYALDPDQVAADIAAAIAHVRADSACNGTVALAGFCWGGSQTFRMATLGADVASAFVFYGSAPEGDGAFEQVSMPVYGFYGGDDARVNASLPRTETGMAAAGKRYEPVIYPGAGHAFLRKGEAADAAAADRAAHAAAWERMLRLLGDL